MSTPNATAFEGRWGWYALDFPAFLEIKEFHKLLLRDRRATKRKQRWMARLPHNRTGPEPRCVGTDQRTYAWVLAEYRRLRHPASAPELVQPIDLPEDWRARHAKLSDFYADAQGQGSQG